MGYTRPRQISTLELGHNGSDAALPIIIDLLACTGDPSAAAAAAAGAGRAKLSESQSMRALGVAVCQSRDATRIESITLINYDWGVMYSLALARTVDGWLRPLRTNVLHIYRVNTCSCTPANSTVRPGTFHRRRRRRRIARMHIIIIMYAC